MNEWHFGARPTAQGTLFRLWAPAAKRVDLRLEDKSYPLLRGANGWFSADIAGVTAGARYKFRIDDATDVPDPASAFQPDDVSGPSEVIDHAAYQWRAMNWRGRPWQETVVIETHVGTFTPEGTYRAMIGRLDHLVATGITALELMPLADFAGTRNWGYDGVLWYAPDSTYGRPDDLKALIDEAHLRGLMVFLDVVYNHFGPEGNYLGRYAPGFFTDAQTPWGSAIDYRVPQVRAFAIENALYWLREYRFDGLRLDAVHAIAELGEISMLHDLSQPPAISPRRPTGHSSRARKRRQRRKPAGPRQDPPRGKYRAQWNDDYHHAWHVLLTGETQGYYRDFAASPLPGIARALASGFIYQGEASAHRGGQLRGEPSGTLAPTAFINFLQDHDQIGNRPLGDRLESNAASAAIEAALAITLLAPISRCCSWAKSGARRRRFRSSAISRANSPRPCARGAAANTPGLTRNMTTRFQIRFKCRPFDPRCSNGTRAICLRAAGGLRWCGIFSPHAGAKSFPGWRARPLAMRTWRTAAV